MPTAELTSTVASGADIQIDLVNEPFAVIDE
jgi:hypothetical protein